VTTPETEAAPEAEPEAQSTQVADENIVHLTCVRCPKGCDLCVIMKEGFENRPGTGNSISSISGYDCRLGLEYAAAEIADPHRMVTLSITVAGSREPLSVKTAAAVPKSRRAAVVVAANALRLHAPIPAGTILTDNIADTGVALIATKSI
jgi:CxxC motif-containing protein